MLKICGSAHRWCWILSDFIMDQCEGTHLYATVSHKCVSMGGSGKGGGGIMCESYIICSGWGWCGSLISLRRATKDSCTASLFANISVCTVFIAFGFFTDRWLLYQNDILAGWGWSEIIVHRCCHSFVWWKFVLIIHWYITNMQFRPYSAEADECCACSGACCSPSYPLCSFER